MQSWQTNERLRRYSTWSHLANFAKTFIRIWRLYFSRKKRVQPWQILVYKNALTTFNTNIYYVPSICSGNMLWNVCSVWLQIEHEERWFWIFWQRCTTATDIPWRFLRACCLIERPRSLIWTPFDPLKRFEKLTEKTVLRQVRAPKMDIVQWIGQLDHRTQLWLTDKLFSLWADLKRSRNRWLSWIKVPATRLENDCNKKDDCAWWYGACRFVKIEVGKTSCSYLSTAQVVVWKLWFV